MAVTTAETRTRARTRAAILRAAIGVLTADQAASLGDIADAAGVARSTLHRYYPEREDLIAALRAYARDEICAATTRARLDDGPAIEALARLCHEYFDHWDTLTWSYLDSISEAQGSHASDGDLDPALSAVISRGHADGTIDATVPDPWLQQVLWALLYSAAAYARQGATKHAALTLLLTSLRRLAAPDR